MNITIFHYHLNPGGVTRIIESQVTAFRKNYPEARMQIITGYCENEEFYKNINVEIIIESRLNYLVDDNLNSYKLDQLKSDIYNSIDGNIEKDEILHVHNLNLGKNPIFTLAINQFLNHGYKIVNHAHDFAEDRPANMGFLQKIINSYFNHNLDEVLYPDKENYLIAVLNQFDYDRVIAYGVKKNRIFLWPNPVHVDFISHKSVQEQRKELVAIFNIPAHHKIITYPVRVIQRKNIGELILLSSLFKNSCTFLVTLPPRNPVEIQFYKKWMDFCTKNNIPIIFEAGLKSNFETIIQGSDYCITTSVKEGFGMSYLEPWLLGTPVIGRNIEYVTTDIMKKGVKFPLLYNKLLVPYKKELIDFKLLTLEEQQFVISKLIEGTIEHTTIIEQNNFLKHFPPEINGDYITDNQNTIKSQFSLDKYAERIFNAYKTIS